MKRYSIFNRIIILGLTMIAATFLVSPTPVEATAGVFEFTDDFESYPVGTNPTDVYDFFNPDSSQENDLYQVGLIGSNQVLQYLKPSPNLNFPVIGKMYKQEFTEITKVGATFYYTNYSIGQDRVYLSYESAETAIWARRYASDVLHLYQGSTPLAWVEDLWTDIDLNEVSHRIEIEYVDGNLIASITRLDTMETKSTAPVPYPAAPSGTAGFAFIENASFDLNVNVDDFYVRGTLPPAEVAATESSPEIYPGDTVDVTLNITGLADIYGAQTECVVDPAVLAGQSNAWGNLFDPANRYIAEDNIDAGAGLWDGAISLLAPAPSIYGDGLYTTLTYQGVAVGSSNVTCDTLLVDQDGNDQLDTYTGTSITVLPFATNNGVATYQGRDDHTGIGVTATGSIVTRNATTTSDGSFSLIDLKADTYNVEADATLYLPNCTTSTVAPGDAITLDPTQLRGGDTDDDDNIDIGDAALIASNFRLDVPPGATNADINGDGTVNIRDLVILASNYGRSGCQGW